MIPCPCRYCTPATGRSAICHSQCPKYIDYKAELDKIKEMKLKDSIVVAYAERRAYARRMGYMRYINDANRR